MSTRMTLTVALLCSSLPASAFAQDYPAKPIRIITAEAGGGADLLSRIVAQGITTPLGQPVIVDFRGGAGTTLAAGLVVLAAALAGSQDERAHESAVLRALGASRGQLARAQAVELVLGGAAAGLLAALGAVLLAWLLAHSVFDFPFVPRWWTIPATMAAGGLGSLVVGWIGLRKVLASPPIEVLRG